MVAKKKATSKKAPAKKKVVAKKTPAKKKAVAKKKAPAKKRKPRIKINTFTELPNFLSVDRKGSCVIYELGLLDEHMMYTEALYNASKIVRYDGNDAIVEDAVGANAKSIFLTLRTGDFMPETDGDDELCWYEKFDESGAELTMDDLLVLAVI